MPAFVGNDASLGAIAEHIFGAGIGVTDLVYLNGGASGIGGGVIANGALLRGVGGYAGEFGQNRPGVRDHDDRISIDGTLEVEVSRSRLVKAVGLDAPDEDELAVALATGKDTAVRSELERQSRVLAVALSNAVNVLNPEVIVLGGFLAALYAFDPRHLAALVREQSVVATVENVRIVPAALGADLLVIGAGQLVFASLIADPALRARYAWRSAYLP